MMVSKILFEISIYPF